MRTPGPIRHLVVVGHPTPTSFNHAVAETYCAAVRANGQTAVLRDLYARGFDPVLAEGERPGTPDVELAADVNEELDLLRSSDVLVLVYPIWFGLPPAIIKGYVDRVLGAGFRPPALKLGAPHPLLEGKRLAIFSSSATTRPWLDEQGQFEAMRQAFDRYLVHAFHMRSGLHVHFDSVVEGMSERTVYEHLETARQTAAAICADLLQERHANAAREALRRHAAATTDPTPCLT